MDNFRGLKDKVVVITGGCGDIGAATALKLAELGAKVVLFDTETGRVWRLDITNPDKPVWKLLVEAPK